MRVVLLTKYPPIQGGVSSHAFATASELQRRGHDVTVVTNADEVSERFRHIMLARDADVLRFPVRGAAEPVTRLSTHRLERDTYGPWSEPYASKLAGLALDVLEERRADVIFSSYLEPYGFAASVVAKACGIPLVLQPAGSDVGRLAEHANLRPLYRNLLESADAVLTRGDGGPICHIAPDAPIVRVGIGRLPSHFRRPHPDPELAEIIDALPAYLESNALPAPLIAAARGMANAPWPELPTILVYGKIGPQKGTFDLTAALSELAQRGDRFNFVIVPAGPPDQLLVLLQFLSAAPALAARTMVLPPIAPWHIPWLIRSATAVCVLEHGFAIAHHAPVIARETLAAGGCLVCSAEIAAKQYFSGAFDTSEAAVVVSNPGDRLALAAALRRLITSPALAAETAARGTMLMAALERALPQNPTADYLEQTAASTLPS